MPCARSGFLHPICGMRLAAACVFCETAPICVCILCIRFFASAPALNVLFPRPRFAPEMKRRAAPGTMPPPCCKAEVFRHKASFQKRRAPPNRCTRPRLVRSSVLSFRIPAFASRIAAALRLVCQNDVRRLAQISDDRNA